MAEGDPIQNISMVEIIRLAIERGEEIKALPIEQKQGKYDPKVSKDNEIFNLLEPLKVSGQTGLDAFHKIYDLVWKIGDQVQLSSEPVHLKDALNANHNEILSLVYSTDRAFGVDRSNPDSTTMRYYEELNHVPMPQKTAFAEAESPAPVPPSPPSEPGKPTYRLYPMLELAAAEGHKEGLTKKWASRATPSEQILEKAGLLEKIDKIQADYPGINDSLLKQTCEAVIDRAQSAGKGKKDFFVDLALTEKEIGQLESNVFSLQSAFPDIGNELGHVSNAVATKERGHKMAMSPLKGFDPTVYNSPAQRDRIVAQKRAAAPQPPAPPPPPAPANPTGRAEPEPAETLEQGEADTVEQDQVADKDKCSWVRRTAAGATAAAAVVSIGAGIKGQADSGKQGQNPDGSQQEQPRSRFGTGAKIALGAALAVTALLIAKPELVGLGGNGAGRSR